MTAPLPNAWVLEIATQGWDLVRVSFSSAALLKQYETILWNHVQAYEIFWNNDMNPELQLWFFERVSQPKRRHVIWQHRAETEGGGKRPGWWRGPYLESLVVGCDMDLSLDTSYKQNISNIISNIDYITRYNTHNTYKTYNKYIYIYSLNSHPNFSWSSSWSSKLERGDLTKNRN